MTDYPTALAAARNALQYGDPIHHGPALRDLLAALDAPAAAVPEGGLRDSVLNSAKFRASCYALVGIVEGIQGLGRCWTANGERLKDTPEWVAFYNCVASMRNGTFNQASAEQAQQPAAAVPEPMPPVPDSMGLSREQREVEDAFRRGWNSCRARVMQLSAAALAERKGE